MKLRQFIACYDVFYDTHHWAERLDNLARDPEANLSFDGRRNLIMSRQALLGLYELCEDMLNKMKMMKKNYKRSIEDASEVELLLRIGIGRLKNARDTSDFEDAVEHLINLNDDLK